jgi:hypothetical protein
MDLIRVDSAADRLLPALVQAAGFSAAAHLDAI